MPATADARPVLRALVQTEAAGVDPDPAFGRVMARALRLRRRRRVAVTAVAIAMAVGGGAVVAAAVDPSPGERTSTYATEPATEPTVTRSYRVWGRSEVVRYPHVGLTLEASSVEFGPVAPGIYSHEVDLRADRPVTVETVRFVGWPGVAATLCGPGTGEDDRLCDEPDRSVDGDGWSLAAGETSNVTLFFDTERVAAGPQVIEATVATSAGTIQVPIHLDVLASDEPPVHGTSVYVDGEGPGTVRLRPPDWRATVEARSSNAFTGAPYTVVDATGAAVTTGAAGHYGEAILTLDPGTYTVRFDRLADGQECGYSRTVEATASHIEDVELTCPS